MRAHLGLCRVDERGDVPVELVFRGDAAGGLLDAGFSVVFGGHVELVYAVAEDGREADVVAARGDGQEVEVVIQDRYLGLENLGACLPRAGQELMRSVRVVSE